MTFSTLVWRGLAHYWRNHLAVVCGVAVAVAALSGALVVGDSVRGSLRELVIGRLGRTDLVIAANLVFRAQLARELSAQRAVPLNAYAMLALEGIVSHPSSGRSASKVSIYGVDEEFWKFHGVFRSGDAPLGRTVRISPALAAELGAGEGDGLLLRLDTPTAIPVESLHGRKDQPVRSTRVTAGAVLAAGELGEFSLRPTQASIRAVFVSLDRLQRELGVGAKANVMLIQGQVPEDQLEKALRERITIGDMGVRIKVLDAGQLSLESTAMVLNDALELAGMEAARDAGLEAFPVVTYLVNSMRVAGRETPYSLVTALDPKLLPGNSSRSGVILNEWAARDLGAKPGDRISFEYFVWRTEGRLDTGRAAFDITAVVPIKGAAADRDYAPDYPGITESTTIHDWDPPFPMDLGKIRKQDEDYWDRYRTTPKAFLAIEKGQQLWATRFGRLTSIRLRAAQGADPEQVRSRFEDALKRRLDPRRLGISTVAVRAEGLEAAHGATDFGLYFLYFSFFLIASALLLVGLFFRLGVEQRSREAGLLRALGYRVGSIGRLFLMEGLALGAIGAALGTLLAAGYAAFILHGLRTWWADAVGTNLIRLHLSAGTLFGGALGGVFVALAVVALTVQSLRKTGPRALLKGAADPAAASRQTRLALAASIVCAILGGVLAALAWAGAIPAAGAFFGAGALLLIAVLAGQRWWLARGISSPDTVWRLGLRNAAWRPGRSVLSMALIAFATFLILALSAFRQEGASRDPARHPGTGGFALVGEAVLPVIHNPGAPAGREELGFAADAEALFSGARILAMRLRPGDDSSCLNLYQPRNPRILGVPPDVLSRLPLSSRVLPADGIPAYVDANSLQYVLHRKVGDELILEREAGKPVRLRIAGALRDSVFQSEILIAESDFLRHFPEQQGFRMFLVEAPGERLDEITTMLEDRLKDYGLDMQSTVDRLAGYHRVENAYISTFQMLGGLGLLLGTAGLAAVLLRNVLERRKELALLRAVGYQPRHLAKLVLAENALLLVSGVAAGAICAVIAILPALAERGAKLPLAPMAALIAAVLATGLLASILAVKAALGSPLLASLRSE